MQLPGGEEAGMRCRPYNVSPLQLLAPPTHAVSPAEFYQLWQALPHRAQVRRGAVRWEGGRWKQGLLWVVG